MNMFVQSYFRFLIYGVAVVLLTSVTDLPSQDNHNLHLMYSGKLVDLYLDKALYENPQTDNFYIQFQLVNKTDKTIGVEAEDYWNIFPNQWMIHAPDYELFTFERLMEPEELDLGKKDLLDFNYRFNRIHKLAPKESVEFYKAFGANRKKDVEIRKGEVLTINFDGQLFLTDGEGSYEVINAWDYDQVDREMHLKYPLEWKRIPKGGWIIEQNAN